MPRTGGVGDGTCASRSAIWSATNGTSPSGTAGAWLLAMSRPYCAKTTRRIVAAAIAHMDANSSHAGGAGRGRVRSALAGRWLGDWLMGSRFWLEEFAHACEAVLGLGDATHLGGGAGV